ncbi:cytochrome b/b6 domain-containing protein [Palleronia sp. THAF1]|uniref:cytochrome b/b6 domain-containing protein n=1 Tax=Palleronia sp. THAF1 TaxID=2587842 RepID=UPI000F52766E|nr:cytochrome b/b6 domain-containing protein [Palleronia sp. THAF1]
MTGSLYKRLPARRTWLRALHLFMIPLFIWFLFITPDVVVPFGPRAFQFHSILALIFVTGILIWYADYLRRGLAGRPGPKLPRWGRILHRTLHLTLIWGLFFVALSGFLLGLTSDRMLKAGGFLPIAPPMDMPTLNYWIGKFHTFEYYTLGVIALVHALFHIWRHWKLRDNALRIMAPKALHRYL